MGIILGLNAYHADSSACIIKDTQLQFAIEEERLNRIKHWAGFPIKSIEECLKQTNTNISEITDIAINTNPLSNIKNKISYSLKNLLFGKKKFEIINRLKKKISIKKELLLNFKNHEINKNLRVHYIDHHTAHIASAFFPSKFKKAIGLSIDGFGDFCSVAIAKCIENDIKIYKKIYFPHSLGLFYEASTQLIGFNNYGEEYKFMGLSSYGQPIYYELLINNIFISKEKEIRLNLKYFNHNKSNYNYNYSGLPKQDFIFSKKIFELLNIKNINEIDDQFKKDIASSVQKIFEFFLEKIIDNFVINDFSENIVYAGGCALNSLANGKILNTNKFKNLFIPYAPGDSGGAIGSAIITSIKKNKGRIKNISNPYLGNHFNNTEIENSIKKTKLDINFKISKIVNNDELNMIVAKLIYENKIIGWFKGKMEFGARALGNRSILANPCNPNIKDIINKKIKKRENFRPFAPSILIEKKEEWFSNKNYNPYMSCVEKISEKKKKLIPGVIHIDGTGRVQTVTKEVNKDFYHLIESFYKLSDVPILLNTSFNENEPIVRMPEEAIDCFLRTEMDVLVLENYIVERN
jgi:carbamoyltransferase